MLNGATRLRTAIGAILFAILLSPLAWSNPEPPANSQKASAPEGFTHSFKDGNEVFTKNGVFFTPTAGTEQESWQFNAPSWRRFKKITVEMDVTHGPWYPSKPAGAHNIFWFTRKNVWRSNTIGYVNVFGPGANKLKQMTNIDLGAGETWAKSKSWTPTTGQTYRYIYTYNCFTGYITLVVKKGNQTQQTLSMTATAQELPMVSNFFTFYIGQHDQYNESPTHGWDYANLKITMEPDPYEHLLPVNGGSWNFNEGSGTNAADASGNGHNGTLAGGTTWTTGVDGTALQFDGNNDRLSLPADVLDNAKDVTTSFWIKTTKTGTQTIVSGANASNDQSYAIQLLDDTSLKFYTGRTATAGATWTFSSIADGGWHHVAVVRDHVDQRKPAIGPLTVNAGNTRYFDDGTGRSVVLQGTNTGWELQDDGWDDRAYTMPWDRFIDYHDRQNLNYIRLWRIETAAWADASAYGADPMPYQRTGPGNALDGDKKFDLTKFNQAYFDRMRERCISAGKRGIYICIMLFERHSTFQDKTGAPYPWRGHPFNAGNNINGIDADVDSDGQGREYFFLPAGGGRQAVLDLQEDYVDKVIDTVNDLDNVIFEIANEALPEADDWQKYFVDYVHNYEAGKPKQHLVGFTGPGRTAAGVWPDFNVQLNSNADFVSPRDQNLYRNNPPANDGTKIIQADSDHIDPYGRDNVWAWKSFIRGLHPSILEDFNANAPKPPNRDPQRDTLCRLAMTNIAEYVHKVDLVNMTPRNALASTAYCLGNPGSEYLIFAPGGGGFTVNLSAGAGKVFDVEWLRVDTGAYSSGGTKNGGGSSVNFNPPFSGNAVLYLRDQSLGSVVSTLDLYIDGVKIGTTKERTYDAVEIDAGGLIIGQDQDSVGGGFDAAEAFDGDLDDLRIIPGVLSATEIATLANAGNLPPNTPGAPSGNATGDTNVAEDFDFTTTDPDGDDIRFLIDWDGDGASEQTTAWTTSGSTVTESHTFTTAATYNIKVKAQDRNTNESAWSSAHAIIISDPNPNNAPSAPTELYVGSVNAQYGSEGDPVLHIDHTPVFSAIFNDPDAGDTTSKFQIQVNTASDFSGTDMWLSPGSGDDLSATVNNGDRTPNIDYAGTPLSFNTTYYWRIIFQDAAGVWGTVPATSNSFTTAVGFNTTPTAPTLLFVDSDDAQAGTEGDPVTGIDLDPVFSAIYNDADTGDIANAYRIQVHDDSNFSGPSLWLSPPEGEDMSDVANGARCDDIDYGGDPLTYDTTYYWRLIFRDQGGLWSAIPGSSASFTTMADPNNTPNAPGDLFVDSTTAQAGTGGTVGSPVAGVDLTPVFSAVFLDLDAGDYSESYRIQVHTDSSFSGPSMWLSPDDGDPMPLVQNGNRSSDIYYGGDALSPDTTYYWRLIFQDQEGAWSVVSATSAFTTAAAGGGLTFDTDSVLDGIEGRAYSDAVAATGGTAPYTYAILQGVLPTGVSLNTDGTITGTPESGTAGDYTFTVEVTDNTSATDARQLVITISPAARRSGGGGGGGGCVASPVAGFGTWRQGLSFLLPLLLITMVLIGFRRRYTA